MLAYHEKYNNEHPDKVKQYRQNYYQNNKEKVLALHREYAKANPDKMKQYRKNRYDAIKRALAQGQGQSGEGEQ